MLNQMLKTNGRVKSAQLIFDKENWKDVRSVVRTEPRYFFYVENMKIQIVFSEKKKVGETLATYVSSNYLMDIPFSYGF